MMRMIKEIIMNMFVKDDDDDDDDGGGGWCWRFFIFRVYIVYLKDD